MSPEESIMLCRLVKAACPSQALDQYTPDAWHLILGHIAYADAKQAVAQLAGLDLEPGRARYIEPGHIVAQVKRIRAKRLDDYGPVDPPSGLEPSQYLAWLRGTHEAIASGQEITPRASLTADPARGTAIVARITEALPSIDETHPQPES